MNLYLLLKLLSKVGFILKSRKWFVVPNNTQIDHLALYFRGIRNITFELLDRIKSFWTIEDEYLRQHTNNIHIRLYMIINGIRRLSLSFN